MRQYEEVKNKRMEKDIPCTHDQKKAEVATLLPDKADSRKKKHYVKKDITWRQQVWSARKHKRAILNVHLLHNRAMKYVKNIVTDRKGEI